LVLLHITGNKPDTPSVISIKSRLYARLFARRGFLPNIDEGEVRSVATDYDTPRKTDEELHEESLEELKAQRSDAQSGQIDVDEAEAAENLELPGADLSGEQLAVRVVPRQVDEFTCSRCFLIHHMTQLAKGEGAKAVCKDCN
jgi:hypothetical protein